jgi:hypothetical protein
MARNDVPLAARSDQELLEIVDNGVCHMLSQLLRASSETHSLATMLTTHAARTSAAPEEIMEAIGQHMNKTGEQLRAVRSAWLVLSSRARKKEK